jgi:hypothetical protein
MNEIIPGSRHTSRLIGFLTNLFGPKESRRSVISIAGLTLVRDGNLGYFRDNQSILRAFWVAKPEQAGSRGHLMAALMMKEASGELSEIPTHVYHALKTDTFSFSETKDFKGAGGFIIMFDADTLPFCGRVNNRTA